jgi:alkaline phosphatase D
MTMLGSEQESWLYQSFAKDKPLWSVLGTGTNMGFHSTPENALDWVPKEASDRTRNYIRSGMTAAKAQLPNNFDNWGGYPKARARLLSAAQRADINLVVVTGDSHNGWAFDLPNDGKPAGIEFGGHSVTSPGYETATQGTDAGVVARGVVENNRAELRWMDSSNRGYMVTTLTPQAAINEWVFMESVKTRTLATKPSHKMKVRPGRKILEAV